MGIVPDPFSLSLTFWLNKEFKSLKTVIHFLLLSRVPCSAPKGPGENWAASLRCAHMRSEMERKASAASNREHSDGQAGVLRNSGKASECSIINLSGKKGRYKSSFQTLKSPFSRCPPDSTWWRWARLAGANGGRERQEAEEDERHLP